MPMGAGEAAQQLRALTALVDDWSSDPSTHRLTTTCISSSRGSDTFWILGVMHSCGMLHIDCDFYNKLYSLSKFSLHLFGSNGLFNLIDIPKPILSSPELWDTLGDTSL